VAFRWVFVFFFCFLDGEDGLIVEEIFVVVSGDKLSVAPLEPLMRRDIFIVGDELGVGEGVVDGGGT